MEAQLTQPTGGSSVVEQWTVKRSSQLSIGREFKSPSPDLFVFYENKIKNRAFRLSVPGLSSDYGLVGYDARFTRERSRVRPSIVVLKVFLFLRRKRPLRQVSKSMAGAPWGIGAIGSVRP